MKRPLKNFLLFTIIGLAAFVGLFAIWHQRDNSNNPHQVQIIATNFPGYDFARTVAASTNASVRMLTAPGADSHSYEPTPQDIIDIQNCDLFISTGGESEAWVDQLLESSDATHLRHLKMLDLVEAKTEAIAPGMTVDDEDAGEENELDEHVWTIPANAAIIAAAIADQLTSLNPSSVDAIQANLAKFQSDLTALDQAFRDLFTHISSRRLIVADRFPFRYFTDAYQLDYAAAFPGCAEQSEASAATIAYLIEQVTHEQENRHSPVTIFVTELSNRAVANTIASATGATIRELHSAHNVSSTDFAAGVTYLDLQYRNLATLTEALQ